MTRIVFAHANSFPASTYRLLFSLLQERGYRVSAIERLGHDTRYPVTSNWPHLVRQLADFARAEQARSGEAAFLVGHSLGGFLSTMVAAQHPELARGVLLLDSPLIGGWRAAALALAKGSGLAPAVTPGRISQKRRHQWPSTAAALAHFQQKKSFARWDAQMLQDYVTYGLHDAQGQRVLAFERQVETAIYNTLPHNLGALLRRHPLRCPVAFIGGSDSRELQQVGLALTRRVTQGRISLLPGSHLFPMEQPQATAQAIAAALARMS